jgi:hypothetical protein
MIERHRDIVAENARRQWISQNRCVIQHLMRRAQAGGTQCGKARLSGLHGTGLSRFHPACRAQDKKIPADYCRREVIADSFFCSQNR